MITANPQQLLKTFLRDVSQKNKLNHALEISLKEVKPVEDFKKVNEIPFSSDRKYSACIYEDMTLVLGAPEMLLEKTSKAFERRSIHKRIVQIGRAHV